MLNGKIRCFVSTPSTRKTVKSNTTISPIVVLEKLPIKIVQSLFIEKNIIVSNELNHTVNTENQSGQKSKKNKPKYKKRKKKFTRFKKRIKEAKMISNTVNNSEKLLEECNTNLAVEKIINKLETVQNMNKNNLHIDSSFSKFPRVILKRLSVKIKKNLYTDDNEYPFHNYNTELNDKLIDGCNSNDENIQESPNEETKLKEMLVPESNVKESALTESEQKCNEIENKVEGADYLDTDINNCDMDSFHKIVESEIYDEIEYFESTVNESNEVIEDIVEDIDNDIQTEVEEKVYGDNGAGVIANKKDTDNDIKIEFEKSLDKNYEITEVFDTKKDVHDVVIEDFDKKEDFDIIITENFFNTENVIDDVQIKEDNSNLLSALVIPQKIFDDTRDVYKKMDVTIMNHEKFGNEKEIKHSRSDSDTLQEVFDQLEGDMNTGGLVDKWLIDESNSSSLNFNSNSQLLTEIKVAGTNESEISLFVVKCLKCNIVQPRNRIRIIAKCKICTSILYHECLICQNKYQSIYTMYSHLSRKHQVEKSIVEKFKKSQSATVVKDLDHTTNYLHLEQYHDKRDEEILHTVPNPITAYCLDCQKQVLATEKSEKWCSTCKTKYIFLCNSCKYIRKNYGQIRLHVLHAHAKKILKCPNNCGKSFSYSRTHYNHIKSCKGFPSVSNIKLTKVTSIQVNKSYCYKCGQYFENRSSMLEHVNDCGKSNRLSCEHCDFETDSKNTLEKHLQTKHMLLLFWEAKKFQCENCKLVFPNHFRYSTHAVNCGSISQEETAI